MKICSINRRTRAGVLGALKGCNESIAMQSVRCAPVSYLPSFAFPFPFKGVGIRSKILYLIVPAMLLAACEGGGGGSGAGGGPAPVSAVEFVAGNTDTSLIVAWKNPNQQDISGFNIIWENTQVPSNNGTEKLTAADVNVSADVRVIHTIKDLLNNANYNLTIVVIYEDGRSASVSPPGTARTGSAGINTEGDIDRDGVLDATDAFRADACAGTDTDGDGRPDSLVTDCDTDLTADNCRSVANADQANTDKADDGGDACDEDDDNDDVPDNMDAFRTDACASADADKDGDPDTLVTGCVTGVNTTLTEDMDDDNDNVPDLTDVDDNNNSLIEIYTLDDLARLRDDLDGDGMDDGAIPEITPVGSDGCPSSGCKGYELARSLSFSDEASYNGSSVNVDAWTNRAGSGWVPIGSCTANNVCTPYTSVFDGGGYAIADLFISVNDDVNGTGLFGALNGTIQNMHLLDANVSGGASDLGLLVGYGQDGQFTNLAIAGGVIMSPSARTVGGLVGEGENAEMRAVSVSDVTISAFSTIGGLAGSVPDSDIRIVSVSDVTVTGDSNQIGGISGFVTDMSIRHAYAVGGSVFGLDSVGGLFGAGQIPEISYSYTAGGPVSAFNTKPRISGLLGFGQSPTVIASYWDNETTRQPASDPRTGDTLGTALGTAQLQNPTDFTGIYAAWGNFWCDPTSFEIRENRTDPGGSFERLWDLGDANQYPVLNCLPVSVEEQQQRQ